MRTVFGRAMVGLSVLCVGSGVMAQVTPGEGFSTLSEDVMLEGITVRPGYEVTAAVSDLPGIRFLEFGARGELYVSVPRLGQILTLEDEDKDGVYEKRTTFIENRDSPGVHGMHFFDGWLWYTTSTSVWKGRDNDGDGSCDEHINVLDGLPGGSGHWWRPILVTETHIYTGVGDPGNISDTREGEREKIFRFNHDGTGKYVWSSGIRNTEKLRLRPGTTEIWGCDHGSDNFGAEVGERFPTDIPITDYYPPDELNRYEDGEFYGHPFLVGKRVPRIEYQDHEDLLEMARITRVPFWEFPAHAATNGFTFLEKSDAFPEDHAGDMFVACHGSWNRSYPSGYDIVRVLFDDVTGLPYGSQVIVDAKEVDGAGVYLRPVDCAQAPDGSVLFSFDHNIRDAPPGAFRIRWVGEEKKEAVEAPAVEVEDEEGEG